MEILPQTVERAKTEPLCPICGKQLTAEDLYLNAEWHASCAICEVCKNPISSDILRKSLASGAPIQHTACAKVAVLEKLREKQIPILIETLAAINEDILSFRNSLDGQISDVELLNKLLTGLKEVGANVKFVLDATKDKIRVRDSQEYAEKIRSERAAKKEAKVAEEKEKLSREAKSEMFAKERANPRIRDFRKAVEAMSSLPGMTREMAVAAVSKQMGINEDGSPIQ